MSRRKGHIYALCTPGGRPFYIGRTVQSPGMRLGEHVREATTRNRQSPVHHMVRHMVAGGKRPAIWVLESDVRLSQINRRERYWIRYYRKAGFDMLNYTGGGNGCLILPEAAKRLTAAAAAKQPRSVEGQFRSPGVPA